MASGVERLLRLWSDPVADGRGTDAVIVADGLGTLVGVDAVRLWTPADAGTAD